MRQPHFKPFWTVSVGAALIFLFLSPAHAQTAFGEETPPATPGRVQVSARVDRSTVGLGETIVLTVDVSYPQDLAIDLPAAESLRFPPFEVRDAVETTLPASGGRRGSRYTVRLAAYDNGKQTIPPLEVSYRLNAADQTSYAAQSDPIVIDVQRVAGVPMPTAPAVGSQNPAAGSNQTGQAVDILDIKPMNAIPTPWWIPLSVGSAVALVLILAAATVAAVVRRKKRRLRIVPATPHGIALAALERLEAENLPRLGHVKAHYDRLAEILRTYLAQQYDLPVLEHTTSEVLAMLRAIDFDDSLRTKLRGVMEEADLVKFAKLNVLPQRACRQVRVARAIVESTMPMLPPAGPDQPLPPAAADLAEVPEQLEAEPAVKGA